ASDGVRLVEVDSTRPVESGLQPRKGLVPFVDALAVVSCHVIERPGLARHAAGIRETAFIVFPTARVDLAQTSQAQRRRRNTLLSAAALRAECAEAVLLLQRDRRRL